MAAANVHNECYNECSGALGTIGENMPVFELFLILCDTENIVLGAVLMHFVDKKFMLFVG